MNTLFPKDPTRYQGPMWVVWVFSAFLAVVVVRSLLHILLPDGGAGVIASADLSVEGADNIVAMFGQWGLEQLIIAIFSVVVFFRYRGLLPFIIALQAFDQLGRILVGLAKPFEVLEAAPGELGSYLALPALLVLLIFSLRKNPGLA